MGRWKVPRIRAEAGCRRITCHLVVALERVSRGLGVVVLVSRGGELSHYTVPCRCGAVGARLS